MFSSALLLPAMLLGLGAVVPEFWKFLHKKHLTTCKRHLEPTVVQCSWCLLWCDGSHLCRSWMDISV